MTTEAVEYAWHIYHNKLLGPLTAPIEVRQEHIRTHKPKKEQELRLRLLKKVIGPLSPAFLKAERASRKLEQTYRQARIAYQKGGWNVNKKWLTLREAKQAFDKAVRTYREASQSPEVLALHALECPNCIWDGETIFGGVR